MGEITIILAMNIPFLVSIDDTQNYLSSYVWWICALC